MKKATIRVRADEKRELAYNLLIDANVIKQIIKKISLKWEGFLDSRINCFLTMDLISEIWKAKGDIDVLNRKRALKGEYPFTCSGLNQKDIKLFVDDIFNVLETLLFRQKPYLIDSMITNYSGFIEVEEEEDKTSNEEED